MASLHVFGSELINRVFFGDEDIKPSEVKIGLYNDSSDDLSPSDDLDSVDSEPEGDAYSRQTVSLPGDMTVSQVNGSWKVEFDDQTFDTSDSTSDVDRYFAVVNFESDTAGDTDAQDHIFFTGPLGQTYNLDGLDQYNLSPSGGELT